jgi:hypothetical protein
MPHQWGATANFSFHLRSTSRKLLLAVDFEIAAAGFWFAEAVILRFS